MCGLAGTFQYRAEALPGICLAHRRVAIIDLSDAGAQAMVNAQTDDHIGCNVGITTTAGYVHILDRGRSGTEMVVPHKPLRQRCGGKLLIEHRFGIYLPRVGLRGT